MRVFVTGDIHGTFDYDKIKKFRKLIKNEVTLDDYLIVCGDFGVLWLNDKEDMYMLKRVYKDFPCTILWVDGNHENFEKLYSYPTEDFCGGKVHRITDRILHLKRGEVFNLNNECKIFAFGGAKSSDRGYDSGDDYGWWKEELPTKAEMENGLRNLAKHDNTVDYIVTHDCSGKILEEKFSIFREQDKGFSDYLQKIAESTSFKHWYFGHHHSDRTSEIFTCLYDRIVELYVVKNLENI